MILLQCIDGGLICIPTLIIGMLLGSIPFFKKGWKCISTKCKCGCHTTIDSKTILSKFNQKRDYTLPKK